MGNTLITWGNPTIEVEYGHHESQKVYNGKCIGNVRKPQYWTYLNRIQMGNNLSIDTTIKWEMSRT